VIGNHLIIGVCIPNATNPNFGADISPVSETTDPTARGVRPSALDADAAQKRLSEALAGARIGD
jgi:hypothetical protein